MSLSRTKTLQGGDRLLIARDGCGDAQSSPRDLKPEAINAALGGKIQCAAIRIAPRQVVGMLDKVEGAKVPSGG